MHLRADSVRSNVHDAWSNPWWWRSTDVSPTWRCGPRGPYLLTAAILGSSISLSLSAVKERDHIALHVFPTGPSVRSIRKLRDACGNLVWTGHQIPSKRGFTESALARCFVELERIVDGRAIPWRCYESWSSQRRTLPAVPPIRFMGMSEFSTIAIHFARGACASRSGHPSVHPYGVLYTRRRRLPCSLFGRR